MSLFVILYVWQNIEIVQIKMQRKALADTQMRLVLDCDRLLYEIERLRRIDVIEEQAWKRGMRMMLQEDFEVITAGGTNAQ
jgi:hypothetical protein